VTEPALKPWSQTDDESMEVDGAVDEAATDRSGSSASWSVAGFFSDMMRGPAGSSKWSSMGFLAVAGFLAILGAAQSSAADRSTAWGCAIGIVVSLAAAAATTAWRHRDDELMDGKKPRRAGGRLGTERSDSASSGATRAAWEDAETHAVNAHHQLAELSELHRQLTMEAKLAGIRRDQTEEILRALSEPLLAVDAFNQIVFANSAAERLFDFQFDLARRSPLDAVIKDAGIVQPIRSAREADARAARRRSEHDIGGAVYAMTVAPLGQSSPGDCEETQRHGVVVLFRDVTKERLAARQKSEFVAHAAHELRTPLTSIRAYVEMLLDGEAGDAGTQKEYFEVIQSSAERLGRMIDNMLNISRIEAGTVRIHKEPVALSMIAREAVDTLRPQAQSKGVELTSELTPVMYRVNADRDLMHEAIQNLLSNAIKYTPEGQKVHLKMTPLESERRIRVEVIDTGVGIPEEDLPRMFEKFFRVEANNKMAKGTGLGLNLVKQIVEVIHGGQLTVASTVGKGSTFAMTLPLAPS